MKRKITSFLIAAAMLLSLIPCVFAETVVEGECGDDAEWVLDDTGTLTISGTGAVDRFAVLSRYRWDSYNESIKKVVVSEGITEFAEDTFLRLTALEEVSLPESLNTIGAYAFDGCTSLKTITIPAAVVSIGGVYGGAFEACTALEAINVAEANPNYKSVNGVLYDKEGTVLICYPSGKTETSFAVPEGVEKIDVGSIDYVSALKTVSIPASVIEIGSTFFECEALESISVAAENENYISEDGILFGSGKTKLYHYPAAKKGSSYAIPAAVKDIYDYAFMDCAELESVSIPEGVESIGVSAFNKCTALREIYIPQSVTTMEFCAFQNCISLKKAVVEADIKKLDFSFPDCFSLEDVTLPDGIEIIDGAFSDCTSLREIKLPQSLRKLEDDAFDGCTALTEITIPEAVEYIGPRAFRGCSNLKTVNIPNSVTRIENYAFFSTDLTDVYYDGTETEWSNIRIGENNNDLTKYAEIHYIAKPYVNGALSYDSETGVITVPIRPTSLDCTLVAAAYKDNALLEVTSKALTKEENSDSITLAGEGAERIVVYIWDGFNSVTPMCASATVE